MKSRPPPAPPASRVDVAAYTRQARTYEPDDPELQTKRVRAFRPSDLEHVPRAHVRMHRAMLRAFPEGIFEPGFLVKIREVVQRYTQMDLDLWLHSVRMYKRNQLRALVPGFSCINVIGLQPLSEKLLVEIDLHFAYRVIDKLLGGQGAAVDIHRPLSEIEHGVFSFLALKVLMLFHSEVVNPEQVALRLEDTRSDIRSVAEILRQDEDWMCIAWKMNFDLDVGYVRAFAPASLARRVLESRPEKGSVLAQRTMKRLRRRMKLLRGTTVEARVEAGHIELLPKDLAALDPGDIVLLENAKLKLTGGTPQGKATMLVGSGRRGVLHGDVGVQGSGDRRRVVFKIASIEIRPEPAAHDPSELHGEHRNPEEVVAEYEDPREDDDEQYEGGAVRDEMHDEDWGLDDENDGGGHAQGGGDEEGEYEDDQAYDDSSYQEAAEEDVPVDDNMEEAGPLLGDIPMAMVVELGRVQLSADEVIRLRPGQLVELSRSPADPVDLVINGKLVAKGELVEIEGALGVKILSLLRDRD